MRDAEASPAYLIVYNYQHKPMDWLLAQLQGEGYDPYCFNSALVNGNFKRTECVSTKLMTQRQGKGPLQA